MSISSSGSSSPTIDYGLNAPSMQLYKRAGQMKLKRRWIDMAEEDMKARNDSVSRLTALRAKIAQGRNSYKPLKPDLPHDPRNWMKSDVRAWLNYMTTNYDIMSPVVPLDACGQDLYDMSIADFTQYVPIGGKFLYRDFRLRLHKAIFLQETPSKGCDESNMSPLQLLALTTGKYLS